MLSMENAEEVFHFLEEFSKRQPKTIPQELNDYLTYVARTGDPVYQWPLIKTLFKEKLLNVITDFHETTPGVDIPPYPNVDPFNYDTMKNSLLERLDSFSSAPFTVQRICELLTTPRKQYNRIDKFMRAIEKNILVVSTIEPGAHRQAELENGEQQEHIVNGSDNNSDYNVDVEMEDMSWKENANQQQVSEPQPSSSDAHISVDDLHKRLQAKNENNTGNLEKTTTQYESVTPPELNVVSDEVEESKQMTSENETDTTSNIKVDENKTTESLSEKTKQDVEMKSEPIHIPTVAIPEIKVDDAEKTEKSIEDKIENDEQPQSKLEGEEMMKTTNIEESVTKETKVTEEDGIEEKIESNLKESNITDNEMKSQSEVLTSSEESSSSDNTDGNSDSTDNETHIGVQEESNSSETNSESDVNMTKSAQLDCPEVTQQKQSEVKVETDNYSISDVNSEIQLPEKGKISESKTEAEINHQEENADIKKEETSDKIECEDAKPDDNMTCA